MFFAIANLSDSLLINCPLSFLVDLGSLLIAHLSRAYVGGGLSPYWYGDDRLPSLRIPLFPLTPRSTKDAYPGVNEILIQFFPTLTSFEIAVARFESDPNSRAAFDRASLTN